MLNRAGAAAFALALAVGVAACSSSGNGAYPIYKPGDAGASSPSGPTTPAGNPDVNLGTPSGKVAITIVSPAASGATLSTDAPVDVTAKVTISMGTDVVDPQTVRATIAPADTPTALIATVPLVGPSSTTADQYVGKLPLTGLKTGTYTITVTARGSSNQSGAASVNIKIDAGPLITVLSPVPGQHYKGSLVVLVAIDPGVAPPVSNVQGAIGAMPVNLQPTGTPGLYRAVFDLTLPTPLDGEQLFIVSATDENKVRAELKVTFDVDLEGPTVTATTPSPGTIVGGLITISANITDDGGLNDSTVQVLIGDDKTVVFRLPLKANGGGTYSTIFDTNNLTKCKLTDPDGVCIVRPTLSFRAADNLGNESNVAYEIAVDNIPPIADLTPPKIRTWKLDMGYRCSTAFDPLDHKDFDGDSPNDLCQVPQLFDLRARIEDDGNHAEGLKQVPIATVDPNATAAYVLDVVKDANGADQPLVVDTDGDGFCDDINPKLQATTSPLTGPKQVLKVRLGPVPAGGTGDFYVPDYAGETEPMPAFCGQGPDTDPALNLCGLSPTVAITYSPAKLPAIWSIEPITPVDGGYCFGSQLDTLANHITRAPAGGASPTGWKCIAIVATDLVGNRATSAPIRVYMPDYVNGGSHNYCPTPPTGAGPPPSCTGTYNRTTGVLTQQACISRNFKVDPGTIETCYLGNCD
ncbi:MAG TPA: Ig-like domain-containing protein [Polyangia bacterium]|nr:Ig-like domain-containing protein [Polyangia bacterium]